MKKTPIILLTLIAPIAAFAQTPAPGRKIVAVPPPQVMQNPPPEPNAEEAVLMNSFATALKAIQLQQRQIDSLKQHLSNLDTYLKKCADHVGCTVPAAKVKAPAHANTEPSNHLAR